MKMRGLLGLSLGALVLSSTPVVAQPSLADVEKALDESFKQLNSYTAKYTSTVDSDYGGGYIHKSQSQGSSEWMRQGDDALLRSETVDHTTTVQNGKESKITTKITVVNDGKFLYTMSEQDGGQKNVTKMKSLTPYSYSPKGVLAGYRPYFDLTVLPDESVDGGDCYVIEMMAKPMEGAPPSGKTRLYFLKDSGIQVKTVGFDAKGKVITTSTTTDIALNTSISPSRFVFEIPPDAKVTDMTQQGTGASRGEQNADAGHKPSQETDRAKDSDAESGGHDDDAPKDKQAKQDKKKKKSKKRKLPKLPWP